MDRVGWIRMIQKKLINKDRGQAVRVVEEQWRKMGRKRRRVWQGETW